MFQRVPEHLQASQQFRQDRPPPLREKRRHAPPRATVAFCNRQRRTGAAPCAGPRFQRPPTARGRVWTPAISSPVTLPKSCTSRHGCGVAAHSTHFLPLSRLTGETSASVRGAARSLRVWQCVAYKDCTPCRSPHAGEPKERGHDTKATAMCDRLGVAPQLSVPPVPRAALIVQGVSRRVRVGVIVLQL